MEGYSAAIADLEPDYDLADEEEAFSSEPGLDWLDPDYGEKLGTQVEQAVGRALSERLGDPAALAAGLGPRMVPDGLSEAELARGSRR
jgi:hypothetical protein